MKDEIKEILELLNIPMNESCGCCLEDYQCKALLDYITNLQNQLNVINEYISNIYRLRNKKAIENIDLVIELIKQQPTEDDSWILNKLNGFKYLLQGDDKDVKDKR